MNFSSLAHFALHLAETKIRMAEAEEVVIEQACQIVEEAAKGALGTYDYGWKPLTPSTLKRKAADTPGLETGEMRDSIEHNVGREHGAVVGLVGTNDQNAVYFELGTMKQPPRSFLMEAAIRSEAEIHEMAKRAVAAVTSEVSKNAAILEIVEKSIHRIKETAEELVTPPDDNDKRRR